MKTILLTRSQQNAGPSITRLNGLGYRTLSCPIMKITEATFDHHTTATNIIVTSQNGVEYGLKYINDRSKHVFAVGSKTETAARAIGFHNITTGPGTAEELYQLILDQHKSANFEQQAENSFCHLAGTEIAFDIVQKLTSKAIKSEIRTVYKAVEEDNIAEKLEDLIKNNEISTVLFYSAQAATIFEQIIHRAQIKKALRNITAISLSKRIDQRLQYTWAMKKIAREPNEDSLFKMLEW